MNFVVELNWRGMLHDMMPGTDELLSKGMTAGYIGFDPTADSLHVGSLAQIMTLIHFQRAGHKPVALVGGATGMVGDPSGKSAERNLLSEDVLQKNLAGIQAQLEKFLDFNCGENSAEVVNNYDWFKDFTFLNFIRDVGKHITVNYMMAKDSVKNRINGDTGMSFTEFTYQLVQGYDFYYLWKNKNCNLQMGGSDQWGNIVTGTELIRRKDGGEAHALTTKLIKKADGTKFGKSEGGNIWLDAEKTSPYKFYQFWLNTSDDDAKTYIRIFTLFDEETIGSLEAEHEQAPHLRALQKALAEDITKRVHGNSAFGKAFKSSSFLFGNIGIEFLNELSSTEILGLFEGMPHFYIRKSDLNEVNVIELLATKTTVFLSKGEARKMVQAGGVSINRIKINTIEQTFTSSHLINNRYIIVQKGKKNYFLIEVADMPNAFWNIIESSRKERLELDRFLISTPDFKTAIKNIKNLTHIQRDYVYAVLGDEEELIPLLNSENSFVVYRTLISFAKKTLQNNYRPPIIEKVTQIAEESNSERIIEQANLILKQYNL